MKNESKDRIQKKRSDVPFTWSVGCGMWAYSKLAGVPLDRIFLDAGAIVEAYTKGRPMAEELFGPHVTKGGPTWQGISYGHANCLGAPLLFPEDSEVAHVPIYGSLAEGITALRKDVDFSKQGMFPFYLDLWEKLKRAFPGEKLPFHYKAEGPITTGWILRGHDFFIDLLEEPEATREYLRLITESIITYDRLIHRINGWPESLEWFGVADDIAAMVPPDRWPELVMPYLEQYYEGHPCRLRSAHIEDLTVGHLKYLDELCLSNYDPSVSPKISAKVIRDNCLVPFLWRLNSTHYEGRSCEEIERWVFDAAADGASGVFTYPDPTPQMAEKAQAFIRAAKLVKELLDAGCPREDIRQNLERVTKTNLACEKMK